VFLDALRELEGVPEESFEGRLTSFVEAWITRTAVTGDPAEQRRRRKALLLGLGSCFDAGGNLEAAPGIGSRFRGVVREEERAARADLCARARLHGRRDAAQHFFVAAALTATIGPGGAAHAGLLKEIADARGRDRRPPEGTGFSFVDLAHDHAGIRFACHLLGLDRFDPEAPPPPLPRFLPPLAPLDLPEGIGWQDFRARYRGESVEALLDWIHETLDASLQTSPSPPPIGRDAREREAAAPSGRSG
jgi:hypothetical protein